MQVALTAPFDLRSGSEDTGAYSGRPLLDPEGPAVIAGSSIGRGGLPEPVAPRADTLFGPRGACLASVEGPLVVTDTGHHRVLIWQCLPVADHAPADWFIGQPDFFSEGRNAKSRPHGSTFNVPCGVAVENGVLVVADTWNHRILLWRSCPEDHNVPADLVLGQNDFATVEANRGGAPGPDTLNWCYGVALIDGRLIAADTGNRRVLVWNRLPDENGQAADLVLGQERFDVRDENAGRPSGNLGMRWPHAVCRLGRSLAVADAGSSRVMVWERCPGDSGTPCDYVLGQADTSGTDHNGGRYQPDETVLNMPYGVAALGEVLAVADTANSRLVGWRQDELRQGAAASYLTGQPDYRSKGDNRWRPPVRDSLCWPYSIRARGDMAAVADTGNNRVLIWRAAR